MTSQRTEPRTVRNNGPGYHSQRAVENKTEETLPEAECQANQGKFPDPQVWGSGNICLAGFQNFCRLLCVPQSSPSKWFSLL